MKPGKTPHNRWNLSWVQSSAGMRVILHHYPFVSLVIPYLFPHCFLEIQIVFLYSREQSSLSICTTTHIQARFPQNKGRPVNETYYSWKPGRARNGYFLLCSWHLSRMPWSSGTRKRGDNSWGGRWPGGGVSGRTPCTEGPGAIS